MIKLLWNGVRIHLDMRKLLCVPLKVNFEVALCGEPTTAHVALERTLASVAADVDLESAVATKHLLGI